jgi:DNA-binding protein HU-beta
MAWHVDAAVPYYLTPDGSLWTNGLDGKRWFQQSFAAFPSRSDAIAAIHGKNWGKGWEAWGLARVTLSSEVICLAPILERTMGAVPTTTENPRMRTKRELIDELAERTRQSKAATEAFVDALGPALQAALAAGGKANLPGIGTFTVKDKPARTGRNPQTGAAIEIAARRVPAFSPAKVLKDALT